MSRNHSTRQTLQRAGATLGCLVTVALSLQVQPLQASAEDRRIEQLLDGAETALLEGNYKEAIRGYSAALELSEGRSTQALHGLCTVYLRQSKLSRAQECAAAMLDASETLVEQAAAENLMGAVLLGRALEAQSTGQRRKHLVAAESHLRASLDISSGELNFAWLNLSVALQGQDRLAAARDAQQEYVSRRPGDRTAKSRLCSLRYLADAEASGAASRAPEETTKPGSEKGKGLEDSPAEDEPGLSLVEPANNSGLEPEEREDELGATRSTLEGPRRYPDIAPMKVGGSILPPRKIHSPAPQYTKKARRERVQGVVVMEAVIDEKGRVRDIEVLKGLPEGLTESAVNTAKKWKFEPATRNGEPVPVYFNLKVRFSLQATEPVPIAADVLVEGNLPGDGEEDVQPPVKVWSPSPRYTESARQAGVQGDVILEAIIDEKGDVTDVRVLQGLPMGLSEEAAMAVCRFQFTPATRNGEPVAVIYNLKTTFRLRSK